MSKELENLKLDVGLLESENAELRSQLKKLTTTCYKFKVQHKYPELKTQMENSEFILTKYK